MKKVEHWELGKKSSLDFLQRKIEAEEEKYLKEVTKMVAKQYSDQKYFKIPEIEQFFDPKKNKKTDSQSSIEFQRLKFKQMFDFEEKPNGLNQSMVERIIANAVRNFLKKYEPHTWIGKAANDASSVSFATHVSKLTHSMIDSPSFYDQVHSQREGILATSDLKEKTVDGAVAGNQFAPVFQFLELELEDKKLASVFNDESNTVLQSFTEKPEELGLWNIGFKRHWQIVR